LRHGLVAFSSSGTRGPRTYEEVSAEYYNERLHPTCSDFRAASRLYLKQVFEAESPRGRIADIGCGQSLVAEFVTEDLVLIDESPAMLRLNSGLHEQRQLNIIEAEFGKDEFDWIISVLGDPYNGIEAWKNIHAALKVGGRCIFISPSYVWAYNFRLSTNSEVSGKARFDLSSGKTIFVPSTILPAAEQKQLINASGLNVERVEHVVVGNIGDIKSKKILESLRSDEPVLDIYRVRKV
jgi:SAM-dependent methyltransferase